MDLKRAFFFRNIVYCLPAVSRGSFDSKTSCRSCCCSFHALLRTRCGAWSWAQCCSFPQLLPSCVTWSWTQCCSFPQVLTGCLLSTFEKCFWVWDSVSDNVLLQFPAAPSTPFCLQFPAAPQTEPESNCRFSGILETSGPQEEDCPLFKLAKIKHTDLGFASAGFSFRLPLEFSSRFLVSTYLIWILGSKLILSDNQSNATLWLLDTCLIIELVPLMIMFITSSLSSKNGRLNFCPEKSDRLWSNNLDLTTDQRFGHLLSSTWCFGCCACSFPRSLVVCFWMQKYFGLEVRHSTNVTLLSPHPTSQEQWYRPDANQHPVISSLIL